MYDYRDTYASTSLYVDHNNEKGFIYGVFVATFVEEIDAYCDKCLNIRSLNPNKYFYRAIRTFPYAMLATSWYDLSSEHAELRQQYGENEEIDTSDTVKIGQAYIGIPVHRFEVTSDNILINPIVEWVYPFLVVNNTTTLFSYRENLGLDSMCGDIKMLNNIPESFINIIKNDSVHNSNTLENPSSNDQYFELSLPMWKEFLPQTPLKSESLVEMAFWGGERIEIDPSKIDSYSDDEIRAIFKWSPDIPNMIEQAKNNLPEIYKLLCGKPASFPMVGLKQFRDPGNTSRATFQAIVVADSVLSPVDRYWIYPAGSVGVSFSVGAMIDDLLSTFMRGMQLSKKTPTVLHPSFGFSMEIASKINNVKAIQIFHD